MDNPFKHGGAAKINEEELVKIFIDSGDSNIITEGKNNIFIKGNRGSGKSMLMLYNSFAIKKDKHRIGIYVDCRNAFFSRIDQYFNKNKFQASIVSEHILVMGMVLSLTTIIKKIPFCPIDKQLLKKELGYYFDTFNLKEEQSCLDNFHHWLNKQIVELQTELMQAPEKFIKTKAYSYLSLIDVVISILKKTNTLKDTHFMFLIDDAVFLNKHQQRTLNTWISYRDTSSVSFKVAITSIREYNFLTNQDSAILENHDYITLDLERNFFSKRDEFYRFAKKIVEKRLELSGSKLLAEAFFPESDKFNKELAQIKNDFIDGKYPEQKEKTRNGRKTNSSKFIRAIYFRLSHETQKANLPELPYAGFKVLTNISTGIIRNLLVPCFKMYTKESENNGEIQSISTSVQYQVLKEESERMWSDIEKLPAQIRDCTEGNATQLKNILTNFGKYLKNTLLNPVSTEKRILTFVIEDLENHVNIDKVQEIKKVLNIGISSGLLYTRIGADHNGGKTTFYTPNRILWVSLGLDPVGQNGRHPIPVDKFYQMMKVPNLPNKNDSNQMELNL